MSGGEIENKQVTIQLDAKHESEMHPESFQTVSTGHEIEWKVQTLQGFLAVDKKKFQNDRLAGAWKLDFRCLLSE